ncbi:MAG: HPr family phosphocarrier protein [Oscillospiraceae bacterium]|nr:HPr family phosphocarrier protein [Oscillospiraceae bacterium]
MYTKTVKLINATGLHARPASLFVAKAKNYRSQIALKNLRTGREAPNAKSIVILLTLAISCGTEVEISAEGPDEVEAVDALATFIESGCGER